MYDGVLSSVCQLVLSSW